MQGFLYTSPMEYLKNLKNIFSQVFSPHNETPVVTPDPAIQSGFIDEPISPTDWIFEADRSAIGNAVNGVARTWSLSMLPKPEPQSIPFVFDTMSCVTFSALTVIETQLKNMQLPQEHFEFLMKNGYFKDGEINFSDKFTAIMSNTTVNGNTYSNVLNSIRHDGLIPDNMLSFGGENNFFAWHNPNQVSPEMVKLGQEFVRYFDITYERIPIEPNPNLSDRDITMLTAALYGSPVMIATPFNPRHATTLLEVDTASLKLYDTYDPYLTKRPVNGNINSAINITITPRTNVINTPFVRVLKKGMRGADVSLLQSRLQLVSDGVFGLVTHNAVVKFQKSRQLVADGAVGKMTYNALFPKSERTNLVTIKRVFKEQGQYRGKLVAYNTEGRMFIANTMELPWLGNEKNISCIPPGTYKVTYTHSPSFNKYTYEVQKVPDRDGIRFHSVSFVKDLLGCIGLGYVFSDINNDGTIDLAESRKCVADFEAFFKKAPFTLVIDQ